PQYNIATYVTGPFGHPLLVGLPIALCVRRFSAERPVQRRPCRPQRWCSVLQLAELLIYESRFTEHHSRFFVPVISKQAQEFWALLKTYPKQIAMPRSRRHARPTPAPKISPASRSE